MTIYTLYLETRSWDASITCYRTREERNAALRAFAGEVLDEVPEDQDEMLDAIIDAGHTYYTDETEIPGLAVVR